MKQALKSFRPTTSLPTQGPQLLDDKLLVQVVGGSPKGTWGSPKGTWHNPNSPKGTWDIGGDTDSPKGTW
jgi:hypothetical protein